MAQQDPNYPAELRQRLVEILTEFATRSHEAEEGIAVAPPPDEVNPAVDAILAALNSELANSELAKDAAFQQALDDVERRGPEGPGTDCPTCNGTGYHTFYPPVGAHDANQTERCPDCGGEG